MPTSIGPAFSCVAKRASELGAPEVSRFACGLQLGERGAHAHELRERFEIVKAENIPIRKTPAITDVPLIWRYFVQIEWESVKSI